MKPENLELLAMAQTCIDSAVSSLDFLHAQPTPLRSDYKCRAKEASIRLARAVFWLDQIVED